MDLLLPVLFSAPVWVLLLVGIAYGGLMWERHPRVSLLAMVALVGMLLVDVAGVLLWTVIAARRADVGPSVLGALGSGLSLLQSALHAALLLVGVTAAAYGRPAAAPDEVADG